MKTSNTAERLREIMRQRGLKQVDVVRLCKPFCEQYHIGLTKSDLSLYVNGKVEPGQSKLTILEYALDVNPAWLMGYDVPQERSERRPVYTARTELIRIIGTLSDADVDILLQMAKRMERKEAKE